MKKRLEAQFHLLKAIRLFFEQEGFLDVMTPPVVSNPGMETHIHPFGIYQAHGGVHTPFYLHTSPEFNMKKLLSEGFENIFTLTYSFRDEPSSPTHRSQFIMLEWYRTNAFYTSIMDDCEKLVSFCLQYLEFNNVKVNQKLHECSAKRMTINEVFNHYLNINILDLLDREKLLNVIKRDFKDVPLPDDCTPLTWDDLYFLLFLNKIEPRLTEEPFLLLYEFPSPLSALSTIKKDDPRVCERFEIYLNGVELCNCFNELRDIEEQKKRFAEQAKEKQLLYGYSLPEARVLYHALEKGLPPACGIALGVERLLMTLTGDDEYGFWK